MSLAIHEVYLSFSSERYAQFTHDTCVTVTELLTLLKGVLTKLKRFIYGFNKHRAKRERES